jgi:hypothetical protein
MKTMGKGFTSESSPISIMRGLITTQTYESLDSIEVAADLIAWTKQA